MSALNTGTDAVGRLGFTPDLEEGPNQNSAVSWAAIFAGAAGAAALSLLLLIIGTGLGLSAVSPWNFEGISAATFGFSAIAWLSFTQLAASGMGGYLAGRLRTRWTAVHIDEVFFRDTAHGFLTWAIASLLVAVLMTTVMGSIVSGGVRAGAAVAGGAASAVGAVAGTAAGSAATLASGATGSGEVSSTIEYFVDSLFREDTASSAAQPARQASQPQRTAGTQTGEAGVAAQQQTGQEGTAQQTGEEVTTQQTGQDGAAQPAAMVQRQVPQMAQQARQMAREISEIPVGEVTRIFGRALSTGTLPQEDERYIGQLIAQHTSISQQDAEQRVSDGFEEVQTTLEEVETTAREAADEAREASAYAALWMSVTLLLGAFAASLLAVFGGRQRDA